MLWWHWVVLGMVLVVIEMAGPNIFFFIFFGFGAGVVGLLTLLGLGGPAWVQWLLFSVFSVLSLAFFRERLVRRRDAAFAKQPAIDDNFVGEIAFALDDLAPGAHGRAELRGTIWSARNTATAAIPSGSRCVVQRVEGLLLHLVPQGGL